MTERAHYVGIAVRDFSPPHTLPSTGSFSDDCAR